MKIFCILLLITIYTSCMALPRSPRELLEELPNNNDIKKERKIAGLASQIVATNLLKDNVDNEENHVFSPLGISSVLAILAEGSRGDTYEEFVTALRYPQNKNELRESFNKVLENFNKKDLTTPSFKTWFYIYRNNTVKDEYKKILRDNYYVDVKDIERMTYEWSSPRISSVSSESLTSSTTLPPQNSKDVIDFEDLKKSEEFDTNAEMKEKIEDKKDVQNEKKEESKEIVEDVPKEVIMLEEKNEMMVPENLLVLEQVKPDEIVMVMVENVDKDKKDASKFDKVVEDKQYVEVPVIKEEIAKEQSKEMVMEMEQINENKMNVKEEKPVEKEQQKQPKGEVSVEENETIKDSEKIDELKKDMDSVVTPSKTEASNEPEKITIPLKKLEDLEIMQALESHFQRRRLNGARTLFLKDDIASALSANALVTKDEPTKSKMLLFNGLYYRGNWAYPFQQLRSSLSLEDDFYLSKNDKTSAIMMRTQGTFKVAEIERLNSQAIELPYENNRYSLLVVVPNEKDGLRSVIEKLQPEDIEDIKSNLKDCDAEVVLPKFQIEMTSRSESTLKKLGLKKLFSSEMADLSDITEDTKLYVDEIVQHVNLRVDEGASSENVLTASATSRSSAEIDKIVSINRPFVYFLLDNVENFVILAGKTVAPKYKEDTKSELSISL